MHVIFLLFESQLLLYEIQASNYTEFSHSFTDDQKCLAKELRLSCLLNNAACKLKLGEYLEASRLCTKVYSFSLSFITYIYLHLKS